MSPDSPSGEKRLAREILAYFLRNPRSADSLEGVAHWRLLDETIHRTLTETEGALAWLVAEGYMREVSVPGSDHIYVLNPLKQDEARQFVNGSTPPGTPTPQA